MYCDLNSTNYTNILINAVKNSDAVIKASEILPDDLLEFIKTNDKPVLDYVPMEEFDNAYTDFFLNNVL